MVRIVIEVPDQHKEVALAVQALIKDVLQLASKTVGGKSIDYAKIERDVGNATAAIERAAHQGLLAGLDVDVEKIVIEGALHSRVGRYEATYYTMAGPVVVERSLYRKDGERNSKVVDAISLRVGAVADGWLPQTARAMAHHVQRGTAREAEASAKEVGRLVYSKSSFDRVAHAVGELYADRNVEVEDALIAAYEPPEDARSLSVGLDRVSLPVLEPDKGVKSGFTLAWRMAWVATVTLHDRDGNALHTIRYGAMPVDGCESLLHGIAGDVNEILSKRPRLRLALMSDGAHDLVAHLATEVAGRVKRDFVQVVDFWHLAEKLAAAAPLLNGDPKRRLAGWRMRLLNEENAARAIMLELKASGREQRRVGDARPVHEAITYIESHHSRMNYAEVRAKGLPIGSGNIEATCKTLVQVRMKRAGSRWKTNSGRHVLQLRALATSDRWDEAMALTLRPLRKSVRVAA